MKSQKWVLALVVLVCCQSDPRSIQIEGELKQDVPTYELKDAIIGVHAANNLLLDQKFNASQHINFDLSASPALEYVQFSGPVQGLNWTYNQRPFPGETKKLVKQLTQDATSDREKVEAIFDFIVKDYKDWWYPAEGQVEIERYPGNIADAIWGYGYGFCSDSGQMAAAMWQEAGFEARVVKLAPFHTIADVFYDGQWHLYDLQHRTFWEKPDGTVASAEELSKIPQLFEQKLDEFGQDAIGYPPKHNAYWYGVGEHEYKAKKRWTLDADFSINLRQGERFRISFQGPTPIYHPNMWLQYYGPTTFDRNPPWPFLGEFIYNPGGSDQVLQEIQFSNGKKGYALSFKSPFISTRAWISIPKLNDEALLYVHSENGLKLMGPTIFGKCELTDAIKGLREFFVVLVPEKEMQDPQQLLEGLESHIQVQVSHLTVPFVQAGTNSWQVRYQSGQPKIRVEVNPTAPDLAVTYLQCEPELPNLGEMVRISYKVENIGSGSSDATSLIVHNQTTALQSEAVDRLSPGLIPPLKPGESSIVEVYWRATTRQTWYGQNPHVQRFDAWVDPFRHFLDANLENNRIQHHILLAEQGVKPELPGYSEIGMPQ